MTPGEYLLCAFDEIDKGAWLESDFVFRHKRRDQRIKLEEKGRESRTPKVIVMTL